MTKEQMREVLSMHLARYRSWSYTSLAEQIKGDRLHHDCLEHVEGVSSDGTPYQMEFNAFWVDEPYGDIGICGELSAAFGDLTAMG